MKNTIVAAMALIILATGFTSCTKFRENRQYDSVYEHSAAESSYHDLFRLTLQMLGPGSGFIVDPCITKTPVSGGYIVSFGDGCKDLYDIERTGTINITNTGDIYADTTITTVSPSNLTINGFKVEGSLSITTLPLNNEGKRQFKLVVTNGIITDGHGASSVWSCDRVYTQRDERDAMLIFDDTYTVIGTTSGTDSEERFYETTIREDLVYDIICRWPRSGEVTMVIDDLKDRGIVYGEDFCENNADCCDNIVNIEVGGKREREVKLR